MPKNTSLDSYLMLNLLGKLMTTNLSFRRFIIAAIVFMLFITSCAPRVSADDVITAFKKAGLEAERPSLMTKKDYGVSPYVCKGTHFFVPSIDPTAGGRVFICEDGKDRDRLVTYYTELGKSSAAFYSWVYVKGNVVVQINGDLPEEQAKKYEAAIP